MTEPLPQAELKPEVPDWAEKMRVEDHIRYQYQPVSRNALGNPDIYGPTALQSIDIRCPICQHIQPIGPPGKDHRCGGCSLNYKYTAIKANCWLWIWKDKQ